MDILAQIDGGAQRLKVFPRQQRVIGTVNRVAAHLNRVLGRAHDRGADAFSRGRERPVKRPVGDLALQCFSQRRAEIAK